MLALISFVSSMRSLIRFFTHSTWATSRGYRFLSLLCLEAWCFAPRCSCFLVSSTIFGRSSALGSIVVQGLGLLRMFVSLIFFLQLCQYHPVCHYFYGARGDGYFYQSECIEAFYGFFALCFAEVWNSGVFCTCARVPTALELIPKKNLKEGGAAVFFS